MLRGARLRAGFSRAGLALTLEVSRGQLQGIEEERRPPSVAVAERISAVLRLDPWEDALLQAVAVDDSQLRSRRGVVHVRRRGTPMPPWVPKRIAVERAAGHSWQSIADGLNRDGVPTVDRGRWWASSVSQAVLTYRGGRRGDPR
jgi:DNA-binding XRE family transcriptional regulator